MLDEANSYFDEIDEKIKAKFFKSFEKVESGHKGDWFKHLEDEIWEFRERDSSKFYRIFAFWDNTGPEHSLVLTTHGINKKTDKTPEKEIEKAEKIAACKFSTLNGQL